MKWVYEEYKISDNKSLIVLDRVCEMLFKSYWASQRPKESTKIAISNSICYGIYHNDLQVGFALVIMRNMVFRKISKLLCSRKGKANRKILRG